MGSTRPTLRPITSTTKKTKSTGLYSRHFKQNPVDGDVYLDGYECLDGHVPQRANWEEINPQLLQPRPSLSPSKFLYEEFKNFKRAVAHASNEEQVSTSVIPAIEGDIGTSGAFRRNPVYKSRAFD